MIIRDKIRKEESLKRLCRGFKVWIQHEDGNVMPVYYNSEYSDWSSIKYYRNDLGELINEDIIEETDFASFRDRIELILNESTIVIGFKDDITDIDSAVTSLAQLETILANDKKD